MAKKVEETEKNKSKNKKRKLNKIKLIVFIVCLILVVVLGVYIYTSTISKVNINKKIKISDEIKDFDYILEDNESVLYKEYFKQLSKTLNVKEENIDYEKYAELISKLFVADFYNLENKVTKNDVGGIQFIHEDMQENFVVKAKDTIYKNIESDIYNNRKQELPEISDIILNDIEKSKFKYKDNEYDSYVVTLSWTYEKDLGYDDEKIFTIIKSDKKLWLVESKSSNDTEEKTSEK